MLKFFNFIVNNIHSKNQGLTFFIKFLKKRRHYLTKRFDSLRKFPSQRRTFLNAQLMCSKNIQFWLLFDDFIISTISLQAAIFANLVKKSGKKRTVLKIDDTPRHYIRVSVHVLKLNYTNALRTCDVVRKSDQKCKHCKKNTNDF